MTFQLDTTGEVASDYNPLTLFRWSDLSPFTQGYIEAMPWEALEYRPEPIAGAEDGAARQIQSASPLGFSDLAPETLARIIADCEVYYKGWVTHPNNSAVRRDDRSEGSLLWIARQGGASQFTPLTVQLGDDGKVRFAQ